MKIYSAERRVGKTTALVKESAETRAIIVAASYQMVDYIIGLAKYLNLDIPEPITVANYLRVLVYGGLNREQKYLVDELQMMLSQMNVETAMVDASYVEPITHAEDRACDTCKYFHVNLSAEPCDSCRVFEDRVFF